jgi:hypothetical protein
MFVRNIQQTDGKADLLNAELVQHLLCPLSSGVTEAKKKNTTKENGKVKDRK